MFNTYRKVTISVTDWQTENSGNTNKCTILQSIYSCYYLTPTCFSIITIFKEVTPKYQKVEQ